MIHLKLKSRDDSSISLVEHLSSFGATAALYSLGNILIRLSAFLLIPLYTYGLTVSEYGLLSTLLLTTEIMFIFMHLGLRTALLRYATSTELYNRIGVLLFTCLLLNVFGCAIITAILLFIFHAIPIYILRDNQIHDYILLCLLSALCNSLYTLLITIYRAKNQPVRYFASGLAAASLQVCFTIIFMTIFKLGITGVLFAQILAFTSVMAWTAIQIIPTVGFGLSLSIAKRLLRFGVPLIFAMSSDLIIQISSVYMLGYYDNLKSVAIYSLGCKLSSIIQVVLVSSFQIAYEPFLFSNAHESGVPTMISRLLTYLMLMITIASCFAALCFEVALPLIAPEEYERAYLVLILMFPANALRGLYYVGSGLLYAKDKTGMTGVCLAIAAILSVIMNYFTIRIYGMWGAVFTNNIIACATGLFTIMMGIKYYPVVLEWKRLKVICCMLCSVVILFSFSHGMSKVLFYFINIGHLLSWCVVIKRARFFDGQDRKLIWNIAQKAAAVLGV
jgi:O-antigen/teichoic acid export membrane protein